MSRFSTSIQPNSGNNSAGLKEQYAWAMANRPVIADTVIGGRQIRVFNSFDMPASQVDVKDAVNTAGQFQKWCDTRSRLQFKLALKRVEAKTKALVNPEMDKKQIDDVCEEVFKAMDVDARGHPRGGRPMAPPNVSGELKLAKAKGKRMAMGA